MKLRRVALGLICAVLISIGAVSSGMPATISEFSLTSSRIAVPAPRMTVPELSKLRDHDVVLIIDKSHSMSVADCFPPAGDSEAQRLDKAVSRWQWCQEQALQLAKQTKTALPDGLTVVLFAKTCSIYDNANISSVETIFAENKPAGSTDATAALRGQIDAYFVRKSNSGQPIKPLLIAIISDGCPDSPKSFCDVIVKATQRMIRPEEIAITFLQVGNDRRAMSLLNELKNGLVGQNAKFNIVRIVPFPELNKIGLPQALVNIATGPSTAQTAKMSL